MTSIPDIISPLEAPDLASVFAERVRRTPDNNAYTYFNKITGSWQNITWKEMEQQIARWRTGLLREELAHGARVAVMLPNSPDWVCLDIAAHQLGLIVVPLYVNDRPENIAYILEDTEAAVFVLPGKNYYEQLTTTLAHCARLLRIITLDECQATHEDDRVRCLSDWLPDEVEEAAPLEIDNDDTATIVYTSGTTGPPKGVMLSHRNMVSNASAGLSCIDILPQDIFLSFLPLSHMLERTAGYYLPMLAGAQVAFARSIPLLAEDLLHLRPTILVAVPRIFERVHSSIMEKLAKGSPVARKLFQLAVESGWSSFQYRQKRGPWQPNFLLQPLLDKVVAAKVRGRLGGRLRVIISGGAALSPEISKVFIGLGLPIYQGYGLTETSPVVSVNRVENNRPDGVGLPLPGIEVDIGEQSELLVKGPCVMQGYWRRQEATDQILRPDGWLHTGDRATIEDGHIRITGRLKEIIVLSNGEKVSPNDIEQAIALDPLFEQSLIIGEGKPYLVLLAVLARERWSLLAEELGVEPTEESLALPEVQRGVLARVEKLMHSMPGYAFIKKAVLTLEPWTVEQGLLTPTMKIKRKSIMNHLKGEIDQLYRN